MLSIHKLLGVNFTRKAGSYVNLFTLISFLSGTYAMKPLFEINDIYVIVKWWIIISIIIVYISFTSQHNLYGDHCDNLHLVYLLKCMQFALQVDIWMLELIVLEFLYVLLCWS